jgi:TldD protein
VQGTRREIAAFSRFKPLTKGPDFMPIAAPFRPFETLLDEGQALHLLREAVAGADDGELFIERRRSEVISYDDGRVRTASYDASEGFGLRAVRGETAGYAHSTEVSEHALKRAVETARLAVGDGGGTLADAPPATNQKLYGDEDPMADAEFPVKIETLAEIDAYARGLDKRVVQVSATLAASLQDVVILRPEGHVVTDTRPMTRLNVSVIVEENGRRESGGAGGGGRHALTGLIDAAHWQDLAKEALRIALVNLEAVPAPAGVMDVALGPGWPGILLHEAIGHGLEGDFNRKKSSAFAGLMGQQIASKGVTVLDDGTLPDRRGSITVDDEGTPGQKNTLIEDGILVGYMQDRQNARLMGVKPTGNGRRESYAHAPMPRMTNTYMLSGDAEPGDIVADVKDGIYAVGFGGGQVDITNGKFVFSCTEAYMVKDGKVGAPVKGATLIGDGATALKHIRAVGNDLALDPGIGNCGKAGQWVPVGVGQPTLLIGGLTVGGSAA